MWRWVLVLAGCNDVYGLDSTKPRDALVLVDEDRDTVADLEDNCRTKPNTDQSNADGDLLGDICDNCPIIDSPITDDTDNDGIGDVCDPHPKDMGDCLLLVDNFRDKQDFARHWTAVTTMGATVTAEDGQVVVRSPLGGDAIVTENASGGRTDVVMRGKTITDAVVLAMSSTPDLKTYYSCRLIAPSAFVADGPGIGVTVLNTLVPEDTIGRNFVLRLGSLDTLAQDPINTSCRVDYGVSVGTADRKGLDRITGKAGFSVAAGDAVIDAISLSRYDQDATCPATIYR
jgi:hypothetical protein